MSLLAGPRALVLGSGIQGTCTALALARAGWTVSLIDRSPTPWSGASARGEGKVHLGYVYANDSSGATAVLMLEGALAFSELLDRWVPSGLDWSTLRSAPFLYGVMPDSMVSADALAEHYARIDERLTERLAAGARYLGESTITPAHRLSNPRRQGLANVVTQAFATGEAAIDPTMLGRALVVACGQHGVSYHGEHTVHGVARDASGFAVDCTDATGVTTTLRADAVVNCLWDGRLAIDATMGIAAPRRWVYRLKYGLQGTVAPGAEPPPSVTFVLGPYGDVVQRADGRVYLSWYPTCLAGWSDAIDTPHTWRAGMDGTDPEWVRDDLVAGATKALAELVPTVQDVSIDTVAAGVIVAWGVTDIDVTDSELHRRHDIGVHDHDGYLSVDTGKLTTAPLFAQRVCEVLNR